jgi:hypothetical protein
MLKCNDEKPHTGKSAFVRKPPKTTVAERIALAEQLCDTRDEGRPGHEPSGTDGSGE